MSVCHVLAHYDISQWAARDGSLWPIRAWAPDLWDANSWHDISRLILTLISLLLSQSLPIHSLHFHDSKKTLLTFLIPVATNQVENSSRYLPSDAVMDPLWCCQDPERGSSRRYWWGWSAHLALPWRLWTCDSNAPPRMINQWFVCIWNNKQNSKK